MSDTKIAASFRVSLTALVPRPDHQSQMAWAWPHYHAALRGRGSRKCRSCVSAREAYPRQVQHNTVTDIEIDGPRDRDPSLGLL
jgi:hypothetical protein